MIGWKRVKKGVADEALLNSLLIPREGELPVKLYEDAGDEWLMPRTVNALGTIESVFPEMDFCGTADPINLREDQVPAVDAVEAALRRDHHGAILEAGCGKGKTVMALELARRLGMKTVVLVHKSFLMDQWAERIEQFLPDAKVGFWQTDRMDSGDDHDFVIAMVQSLTARSREYPPEQFASFGMVITDEVHRFAAPVWQSAITQFPAKYRLGLTATPNRRDGMQVVFFKHIGPIAYTIKGQSILPNVYRVDLDTHVPRSDYIMRWNGEVNTSKLITLLAANDARSQVIVDYGVRAVKQGRKVLILTDRRAHVDHLVHEIGIRTPDDVKVDQYVGGMSREAQKASAECDVIVGTYSMAQEGLDIPDLDTLLLATPKTSITQSVGRILREFPGKQNPVVVDFVDKNIEVLGAYWGSRKKKYKALGYVR